MPNDPMTPEEMAERIAHGLPEPAHRLVREAWTPLLTDWLAAHTAQHDPDTCLESTFRAERDQAIRDRDQKDHENAALRAEASEIARRVVEACCAAIDAEANKVAGGTPFIGDTHQIAGMITAMGAIRSDPTVRRLLGEASDGE